MSVLYDGAKKTFEGLWFYLLLLLMITIINPLFSHMGRTVLFTVFDREITLESLYYGLFQGLMILAVIFWFRMFSRFFTSDRLLLLFGKRLPRLSLTLSMALRFIPLFKRQLAKVLETQKTLGLYEGGKRISKIKAYSRVFAAVLTWAPENALDTYDSMIARGYSGKRATGSENYNFSFADVSFTSVVLAVFCLYALKILPNHIMVLISFVLFMYPSFLCAKENVTWKYSISKI